MQPLSMRLILNTEPQSVDWLRTDLEDVCGQSEDGVHRTGDAAAHGWLVGDGGGPDWAASGAAAAPDWAAGGGAGFHGDLC